MEGTVQTSTTKPDIAHDTPEGEPHLNGAGGGREEMRQLLSALQAMRDGDFSVRLPGDWGDLSGKVAGLFNDIASTNQRMANQLAHIGQVVGREGATRHRIRLGLVEGAWGEMEHSVNALIDD